MRNSNTLVRIAAVSFAALAAWTPITHASESAASTPAATRAKPIDKAAWARRLAALKEADWRAAFDVGSQLADLPPDDGFAILKENWAKIDSVEARQQILKAWHYAMPYPLHARNHPRILDVLDLGMNDPSPKVQQWAQMFLRQVAFQDFAEDRFPAAVRAMEIPQLPKREKAKPQREAQEDPLADVADVPALDLRAAGDATKRYFLIGSADKASVPEAGYALLIVLPGGDGSAEFQPFVRGIYKNVLDKRWLVVQPVAMPQVVWPAEATRRLIPQSTTEQFIEAILKDVQAKVKLDPNRIFMLGWSSGGPPCYAMALRKDSPVAGAFIAMSVFKPDQMPAIENPKGKAFYLLQSPDDRVTPFRFAESAEKALRGAGAKVQLQQYDGGHGWRGNVWQMIGDGIAWLEKQAEARP